MTQRRQYLVAILGILSLTMITVGVTLTFFSYTKDGSTDNTITTKSITFIYNEESGQGRGITLTDALPVSNELGKANPTNVFNFRIKSTPGNTNIKYTVTARKVSEGNVLDDVVDLYLTDQSNNGDYIKTQYPSSTKNYLTFSDLSGYKNSSIEKVLYEKTITSSDLTNGKYEQDFRLRMWIDENTDYSDGTYNNQIFRIIVNVNANADTAIIPDGNTQETLPDSSLRKLVLDNYGGIDTIKARATNSTNTMLAANDDDGETYYLNGIIEDNYVSFAGYLWRIMRINGDNSIRMILDGAMGTEDGNKMFNEYRLDENRGNPNGNYTPQEDTVPYLYYQNLSGRQIVDDWYTTTIDTYIEGNTGTKYSDYVTTGKYCEAVKVSGISDYNNAINSLGYSSVLYDSTYVPTYTCIEDARGHRYYNSNIALPTFDDLLLAGAAYDSGYKEYYLNNNAFEGGFSFLWTMSVNGISGGDPGWWMALTNGLVYQGESSRAPLRPVINLKSNVTATGTGAKTNPFIITGLY